MPRSPFDDGRFDAYDRAMTFVEFVLGVIVCTCSVYLIIRVVQGLAS